MGDSADSGRRTGPGKLIPAGMLLIILSALLFYASSEENSAAKNESTTIADVTRTYAYKTLESNTTLTNIVCNYSFTVDGKIYRGSGCPSGGLTIPIKNQIMDRIGQRDQFKATVYYDPNNPSTNSLSEYSSSSKWDDRGAIASLCLGILVLGYSLLAALIGNNQGAGGVETGAAAVQQAVAPEGARVNDQQFIDDLDKVLRSDEQPNRSLNG
ncbi:MAG: hypothetical protein ABR956_00230 [Terracidiphilus sp.]|jgi:hypothetical protein